MSSSEFTAGSPDLNTLPLKLGTDSIESLRTLIDPSFQADLEGVIKANPKWNRLISQKKMAVGLVDLSDPYNPIYARINGNIMMYAASLPKIAILLAAMDALEKGELEDTPELREKMRLMISKSNNAAATELMDMLGFEKIESVLEDPKYDLYDEDYGGGLWVGKRYAKTGERHGDPLMGISHGATVTQVCRYYYLMAYGQLISYDRSKEMLDLMADPELHHKFVANLEKIAPQATLYRKSGTWKTYHADSVLVWGPDRRYILVALIEDEDGEKICQNLALVADKLLRSRSTVK
ncbi:MAG: class A beta-lactamase-related serine hydrolase [Anaerolineales bacterium]|nr:class A beta-lactamase-related serine hydrolase [Anaerolineales bacterium]